MLGILVLIVSILSMAPGGAVGRADRDQGDFLSAAGWLLGPAPSTLFMDVAALDQSDEEKIHINAKIHCDMQEPGDHLHVHSGPIQWKAQMMGGSCGGEGDDGSARGMAMGFCSDGDPANATYFLSTSSGVDLGLSRQQNGGFVDIEITGGCVFDAEGEIQGSVKFHDQTPDPDPTESPPPAP